MIIDLRNYLVVGAGAIGSAFGGMLRRAGHEVALVGRPEHIEAIRRDGLRVEGLFGDFTARKFRLYTSISECYSSTPFSFDAILLAVKSHDTSAAVREVISMVGTETPVISLQNGLGNVEAIAQLIGADRAVGARVIFGVERPGPGRIRVTVWADKVLLGRPPHPGVNAAVETFARDCTGAGIKTELVDDIAPHIWGKVLYNAALNPLSALLDLPYGDLLKTEETKLVMVDIISESFATAAACGISLPWTEASDYRDLLFGTLIPATAGHRSSMLQDIHRGKRTEIDALNGAIVRLAKGKGTPVPVNTLLVRLIRALESHGGKKHAASE